MTNQSKVAPVEAQAVPTKEQANDALETLEGWDDGWGPDPRPKAFATLRRFIERSRPTPAAADLTVDGLMDRAKRYRWAAEGESVEGAERVLRAYAAQLVAASPAAAADWQVSAIADKHASTLDGHRVLDEVSFGRELLQTFAPPVAPVGAPTRLLNLDERRQCFESTSTPAAFAEAIQRKFCEVNGIRQGCELATDATKQLREHSVHLAATPIDQDFRRRPASSEAAPSAEGSE